MHSKFQKIAEANLDNWQRRLDTNLENAVAAVETGLDIVKWFEVQPGLEAAYVIRLRYEEALEELRAININNLPDSDVMRLLAIRLRLLFASLTELVGTVAETDLPVNRTATSRSR